MSRTHAKWHGVERVLLIEPARRNLLPKAQAGLTRRTSDVLAAVMRSAAIETTDCSEDNLSFSMRGTSAIL